MKIFTRIITVTLNLCLILSLPVFSMAEESVSITLSSQKDGDAYKHSATLDGNAINEYEYIWHIDPKKAEPYYEGEKPTDDIYIAHDIYYYPELSQDKFKQINYDGDKEWAYFYEAEGLENYIFSTLPSLKTGFPSQMMHSVDEAYSNAVLHINKAGTYTLKGEWHGQINIDLGEDSFDDPSQKVTLILDGANIECTVAPGIVFSEVYECDNLWEERENHSQTVNTKDAGAVIRLADGSKNTVSGTNIFRLLKPKYKDDDSDDQYPAQKKLLKLDGAVYSYRSINIEGGDGVLDITSGFEGLNSELHLTLNGGNININSQDDGINVNEDGVSVLAVNGGTLNINAGLGAEGDGIDSNGYLVINSGSVFSSSNPASDSGLDSDCGSYVNGGTVVSLGSAMDFATADENAEQAIMNLRFSSQKPSGAKIKITDADDNAVFEYNVGDRGFSGAVISTKDIEIGKSYKVFVNENQQVYSGEDNFKQNMHPQMQDGERPEMPQGDTPQGERPQMPQGDFGQMPDGKKTQIQGSSNCTANREFKPSETVSVFSGVDDIRHNLDADGVCIDCENEKTVNNQNREWFLYLIMYIAGLATATIIFVIIILVKRKTRE